MQRLHNTVQNDEHLSAKIFKERWGSQLHFIDWERFNKLVSRFSGGKYLDVGCFNSPMPFYLTTEYPSSEIHAVDHCKEVIDELSERFPAVHYQTANALSLPFDDNEFDYVVAGEIIEHMPEPAKLVAELVRVLKPGGVLAISTPFEEGISQPPVSGEHFWGFTTNDMNELLSPYGKVSVESFWCKPPVLIAYLKKA